MLAAAGICATAAQEDGMAIALPLQGRILVYSLTVTNLFDREQQL
jgi:hypothetical protein